MSFSPQAFAIELLLARRKPTPNSGPADTGIDALKATVGTGQIKHNKAKKTKNGLGKGQRRDAAGNVYNTLPGQTASADHPIGQTDPTKAPGNVETREAAEGGQATNADFESLHPRAYGGKFAAKGTTGPQATAVQQRLAAVGHPVKVDGDFGPKTQGAVRSFQKQAGLTVDGIVGLKTTSALIAAARARRKQ